MKKTLVLSEIFPPVKGGSGRWLWEVYTRIHDNNIIVAAGDSEESYQVDCASDLKTYRINLSSSSWGIKSSIGLKFYWRVYKQIKKIINQDAIEAVHCGRCLPEGVIGYLINKTIQIPYICYVHGEDVETAATSRELRWIVNKVLGGATYLVCNSRNTSDIVLNKWKVHANKVKVVHPGVDTQCFVPATNDSSVRDSLGWGSRPVILTVGRLQERKGHDMMIKALMSIKEAFPNVLYAIIGEGEQRNALDKLVSDLGLQDNVMFMSGLSDDKMIQCYQQCNVFILPNRTVGRDIEGFGMVLVEAQACAKPVIAGNSGGTAETMLVNKSGYIVDCTSVNAISEKILLLLSDKKLNEEMGRSGVAYVNAKLDWHSLSQQAGQLFEKI